MKNEITKMDWIKSKKGLDRVTLKFYFRCYENAEKFNDLERMEWFNDKIEKIVKKTFKDYENEYEEWKKKDENGEFDFLNEIK